ncbi:MAG: hypothetical protein ACI90V_004897 [Bacillariaceae sp.]|jgi:hypothetical protein
MVRNDYISNIILLTINQAPDPNERPRLRPSSSFKNDSKPILSPEIIPRHALFAPR